MSNTSVPIPCIEAIENGILKIIQLTGTKIHYSRMSETLMSETLKEPDDQKTWGNPEWYANTAIMASHERYAGQVNADCMFTLFESSMMCKVMDPYYIFITDAGMNGNDMGSLIGWYRESLGAVISIRPLKCLDEPTRNACAGTIAMHLIGHIFGLIPQYRTEAIHSSFGLHCTNQCVMRQPVVDLRMWMLLTQDRQKNDPFCPLCTQNLKEYFQEN
jgi:hypothetical protein